MRFMMLMIPKGYDSPEQPPPPTREQLAPMGRYNEELARAGVLLAVDGLHHQSSAARVSFGRGTKPRITDGPFTEAKEAIGGYWVIDVKSRDEAIAWASRCPAEPGDVIEVRQIYELGDL